MNMDFRFRPATKDDIQQILPWRYPPPYDIYDLREGSTDVDLAYYLDPRYHYHVMLDDTGAVVAYCSFGEDGQVPGGDYRAAALDIGLGVHPDLTGRGEGIGYVQQVVDFALVTFTPRALRVTIAAFNHRAQRVWQKAGFVEVSRFGRERDQMPFVIYVRSTT